MTALADPTRRAIVERLAAGPVAVGELARGLPVSRPAVSQHLRVLEAAGLVVVRPAGTRRLYQLDPAGVDAIRAYFEQLWLKSLAAFKDAAEQGVEYRVSTIDQAVEGAVRRTVTVDVPVDRAFAVFTAEIGSWWPTEFSIGAEPFATVDVEPFAGGRWLERDASGVECDWGRVLVWDPPRQVLLAWHIGPDWQFHPDSDKASEIAVRFIPEGDMATRVELEHSGFERHGADGAKVRAAVGGPGGWTVCLERYVAVTQR